MVLLFSGFKLNGPSVLKCGPNQEFDRAPTCDDINECLSSQCDGASTECKNTQGGFSCPCKSGFTPNLECRPVGDLGLINGAIPDESITTSTPELGYSKGVSTKIINSSCLCKYRQN